MSHDEKTNSTEKTRSQVISTDQRWEPAEVKRIPVMQQVRGSGSGRITLLDTQNPLVIGRDAGCSIPVTEDTCSRRHAEIRVTLSDDGIATVMVRDLKSSNGTTLDGTELAPDSETPWHAGQTLTLGETVRFQLTLMRKDDAEALEQVSHSPHRDRATGVLNRRGLLEALEGETQHLARHPQESIALILLRIFDFADEMATKKADQTLRHWLEKLLPRVRSGTILGRSSEYEIVAILRHCDAEGAHAAMSRYQAAVQSEREVTHERKGLAEPAIGAVLVTGKYHPEAEPVLRFAETTLFRFGHPGTELPLIEYVQR